MELTAQTSKIKPLTFHFIYIIFAFFFVAIKSVEFLLQKSSSKELSSTLPNVDWGGKSRNVFKSNF